MGRRRSLGRRLALGCGGLIGLVIILAVAAYFILQAVGARQANAALGRIKASGAPTSWAEAIPKPVPADQNAAVLYEKAFAHLRVRVASSRALHDFLKAATPADRRALRKEVAETVAANAPALLLAQQAAKRPKCRFNRDWSNPVALLAPDLWRLREIARLASAAAMLRADEGDRQNALRMWSLNLVILRHLESDPWLMSQLRRYAIAGSAARALAAILETSGLTPDECRSLGHGLARIDLSGPFVKALETERAGAVYCLHRMPSDPRMGFDAATPAWFGQRGDAFVPRRVAKIAYHVVQPLDEAVLLRLWEREIALARKPYREIGIPTDAVEFEEDVPRYALFTLIWPVRVLPHSAAARDSAIATVGLMRAGLGLAAYRGQHGTYPRSLNELRASLKWDVPQDPFSGKDFIYRREGTGYLLYSIGRDLKDDHGTPWDSDRGKGDIVWRMER